MANETGDIVMKEVILTCMLLIVILSGCATQPSKVFHQLGVAYYEKGEYDMALEQFKKQGEVEEHLSNYAWIAATYHKKRQYEDAVSCFQKALATGGIQFETRDFRALFFGRLANCYNNLNQYADAEKASKRAINLDYSNGYAHFQLAWAIFKSKGEHTAIFKTITGEHITTVKGKHAVAAMSYEEAIKYDPKVPDYYNRWGTLLGNSGDYAGATEQFKKAVSLKPNNRTYLSNLAGAFYRQGRYDDAIEIINKAITLQTFTGIGTNIAVESGYPVVKKVMEAGSAKKADILAGDKIIKIDGESTKGWTDEKVTQSLRGTSGTQVVLTIERKGAENTINKTVTRETIIPKEAALSFGLRSFAYRCKGSLEAALKDAEKAYSLDSANDWALDSLGAAYLDRGQYDESIKLLAQVKDSSTARLIEATAYAKQGKMKEAATIYRSIPEEELSPKNVPQTNDRMVLLQTFKPFVKGHRDKARSFESKGQYKEALSELSEAVKVADDTELQDIQETLFSMIRMNPSLSELPEEARKHVLRAQVLKNEGNFEQAATEFKKAIQIAPYVAGLYYDSALMNAELKKYAEAIRYMKIYLKAAPDAPDARDAKDEVFKWEFKMERGE
jgi:tetratricopeptide (TPR) repeat protein